MDQRQNVTDDQKNPGGSEAHEAVQSLTKI
jgi:hypothetical protein